MDRDNEHIPEGDQINENDILYVADDGNTPQDANESDEEMEHDMDEEDDQDDVQLKIQAHNEEKDVFVLSTSGNWLVSGSEDDSAAVWDISTEDLSPILRITNHSDSVHCACFNSQCTLLATGDMSGKVIVTDIGTKAERCQIDQCDDLEWLMWHTKSDILFAGAKDGLVWAWLIGKNGVMQSKNFVSDTPAPCVAGRLLHDDQRLLAVYGDGQAKIWDVKDCAAQSLQLPAPCTTVELHPSLQFAAVGLENGAVAIINTETVKQVALLDMSSDNTNDPQKENKEEDAEEGNPNTVETLAFSTDFPWLAVGTASGSVRIHDYEKSVLRDVLDHGGNAVVKCLWKQIDSSLLLFVSCFDGDIRIWDGKTGSPQTVIRGGHQAIYDQVVLAKDGLECIAVASGKGLIKLYRLPC